MHVLGRESIITVKLQIHTFKLHYQCVCVCVEMTIDCLYQKV